MKWTKMLVAAMISRAIGSEAQTVSSTDSSESPASTSSIPAITAATAATTTLTIATTSTPLSAIITTTAISTTETTISTVATISPIIVSTAGSIDPTTSSNGGAANTPPATTIFTTVSSTQQVNIVLPQKTKTYSVDHSSALQVATTSIAMPKTETGSTEVSTTTTSVDSGDVSPASLSQTDAALIGGLAAAVAVLAAVGFVVIRRARRPVIQNSFNAKQNEPDNNSPPARRSSSSHNTNRGSNESNLSFTGASINYIHGVGNSSGASRLRRHSTSSIINNTDETAKTKGVATAPPPTSEQKYLEQQRQQLLLKKQQTVLQKQKFLHLHQAKSLNSLPQMIPIIIPSLNPPSPPLSSAASASNQQQQQHPVNIISPPFFKYEGVAIRAHVRQKSDELEIFVGDVIAVTFAFPDGWAYGINRTKRSKSGAFPLACVTPPPPPPIFNEQQKQQQLRQLQQAQSVEKNNNFIDNISPPLPSLSISSSPIPKTTTATQTTTRRTPPLLLVSKKKNRALSSVNSVESIIEVQQKKIRGSSTTPVAGKRPAHQRLSLIDTVMAEEEEEEVEDEEEEEEEKKRELMFADAEEGTLDRPIFVTAKTRLRPIANDEDGEADEDPVDENDGGDGVDGNAELQVDNEFVDCVADDRKKNDIGGDGEGEEKVTGERREAEGDAERSNSHLHLSQLSPVEMMLGADFDVAEHSPDSSSDPNSTSANNSNAGPNNPPPVYRAPSKRHSVRLSIASVDSLFALRLPPDSDMVRTPSLAQLNNANSTQSYSYSYSHSIHSLNRNSSSAPILNRTQSQSQMFDQGTAASSVHRLQPHSISRSRSHRLSVASFSASIGAAVASIHENIQASTTAGYSSNWAFGIFDSWWAVEPTSFAFVSKNSSRPISAQPRRAPVMSTATNNNSPSNSLANSVSLTGVTPPRSILTAVAATPTVAVTVSPDPTSTSHQHSDAFIKRNSRISIHPENQPQMLQIPLRDEGDIKRANLPPNPIIRPTSANVPGSASPHHRQHHHHHQPNSSSAHNPHRQPTTTTSILPFLSSLFCPCVVYAQSREMFLRSGGVLENDTSDKICCGPPSLDSSESSRVRSAACAFATLMPCCLCYVPHRALRGAIRARYALRDDDGYDDDDGLSSRRACCGVECGEIIVGCFCLPCALVQERREIVHWEKVVD
ncbi:hypothetical protein HK100_004721, partial [Physocladia obscura]